MASLRHVFFTVASWQLENSGLEVASFQTYFFPAVASWQRENSDLKVIPAISFSLLPIGSETILA
jgi:hypothetical protein